MDIHLLMLNAMYNAPISRELIESAKLKISQQGMENQISIISDFLSEDMTIRMIKNADLIVFPYQETGESSSAAVRMGLASGVPVAVTPLSIFDDVSNVVFRLPGTSPDKLALGIKTIREEINNFSIAAKTVSSRASQWKKERGYSILGRRLKNLLKGEFKYFGSDARLGTQVGKRIGRDIESTGQEGYLIFGPYIPLDAGQYRVTIQGRCGANGLAGARMDVVFDKGQYVLGESLLKDPDECGNVVALHISLDVPCTDLEVRVWVSEGSELNVSMIEITPWQDESTGLQQSAQVKPATGFADQTAWEEVDIELEASSVPMNESSEILQSVLPVSSNLRNQAKTKRKKKR
jgi:hypothetical protein